MFYNYSDIVDEGLSRDDPLFWSRESPVDCGIIRIIGIFLCISSFVGIVLNGSIGYSFIRYKDLRTSANIFIMFITIIGFLASCSILPLTGISSIYCYWVFSRVGCQFEAIMAFLYGCSSSYLLCAVCLTRSFVIIRPFQAKNLTVQKCSIFGGIAVLIAFLWTMLPIIGWNEYTMEGARTSCCINWYSREILFISFNLFLFVFVYVIPLIILIVTNTIIFVGLKRMKGKINQNDVSQKKVEMERRILKSIIITVCGFIFTWSPYAVVFFISAYRGKENGIDPLSTFICACFAKSSVMWIPMLYLSTSTHFKLHFVDLSTVSKDKQTFTNNPPTATNKPVSANN